MCHIAPAPGKFFLVPYSPRSRQVLSRAPCVAPVPPVHQVPLHSACWSLKSLDYLPLASLPSLPSLLSLEKSLDYLPLASLPSLLSLSRALKGLEGLERRKGRVPFLTRSRQVLSRALSPPLPAISSSCPPRRSRLSRPSSPLAGYLRDLRDRRDLSDARGVCHIAPAPGKFFLVPYRPPLQASFFSCPPRRSRRSRLSSPFLQGS